MCSHSWDIDDDLDLHQAEPRQLSERDKLNATIIGLTDAEAAEMSPKELDEFADEMADLDGKHLGC